MFSRTEQSQHIPHMPHFTNKGCPHTGKWVAVVGSLDTQDQPRWVGGVEEEEEKGQCADQRCRGGEGRGEVVVNWKGRGKQRWWPRLIKKRVSDHASNVCLSGPADVGGAHLDIWKPIDR